MNLAQVHRHALICLLVLATIAIMSCKKDETVSPVMKESPFRGIPSSIMQRYLLSAR
jgi:hypothetical protein